jgi:hypothetical protein
MSGSQVEEAGQFITVMRISPSPEFPILTMLRIGFQNGKPVNSGYSGRLRSWSLDRHRTLEKDSSRLSNLLVTAWGADKNHSSQILPPAPGQQERVMSASRRFNDTETEALPAEMLELGRLIQAMRGPEQETLAAAFNRVADSIHRRRRILNLVQEALSQLRLDVKYLMFDLETTRRERDQLQAQLEEEDKGF